MKQARYLGWVFIIVTCATKLYAQQTAGSGTIISGSVSAKNNAIVNASVLLQLSQDSSLVKGCVADSSGNFTFTNTQAGSYFISVQCIGYEDYTSSVFLVRDSMKTYVVPLAMLKNVGIHALDEITIKTKRPVIERKAGVLWFNVQNSINTAGSTAWDVLKKAPNVKTDNQGNVSLRANNNAAIMINNKLVNLSGEDLMNLLTNTSAEDIVRIEIMTNPSARYDAEGSGGLLNIVTKKNKAEGWNGTVTSGYEQNTYAKYNTGLNLNYKHENLTISGNYGYRNGKYLTREYLEQQYANDNLSTFYDETLDRYRKQVNNSYKLDINYAISKKSTIGVFVEGNHSTRNNSDISRTPIRSLYNKIDSTYISNIFINGNTNYLNVSTSYKGLFDTLGKSFNVDIDYLRYTSDNNSVNINNFFDAGNHDLRSSLVFRSSVPQIINIYTAKIDYSHPFNASSTLEAGAKANTTETDNNYVFENLFNNNYINDSTKSNHFNYQENIIASYINFSRTMRNLTVQMGLREEYTVTKGNSLTLASLIKRTYFKVFPTVYIQQKFTDNYQVELNYGRRIRRPSYAYLNPFRYYSTPYSYTEGNPFLQPAYTNSIELIHTIRGIYVGTLYYTSTKGEFIQMPEQNADARTIAFHRLNLNKSISYGISLEIPFELSWWHSYNSVDMSYDQVSSDYLGSSFLYKKMTANISSVQSFDLTRKWSAEISGNYRFPSVSGLFHLGVYSELAVGIKKKLLKDRAVATINFSDILRGTIMPASVSYLNQKIVAKTDNDIRGIRISLSYKLRKAEIKSVKGHDAGNKEEQNRVVK